MYKSSDIYTKTAKLWKKDAVPKIQGELMREIQVGSQQ